MITLNIISLNTHANEQISLFISEPITPIPKLIKLDERKVALGKRLFHDVSLSGDATVSCASCHSLNNSGVDSLPVSIGMKGKLGTKNTPTVLNVGLQFSFFWDGRAETLEQQVSGPINASQEMDNNWDAIIHYLMSKPDYRSLFNDIYDAEPSAENISNAIAEFERSLLTPDGDFDRYLKGDDNAIDEETKIGYQLFKSFGCISCHQGVAVGGNMYEKLGVFTPYYDKKTSEVNFGRYNLLSLELKSNNEELKFEFKVPSLRNVARTAPYFHDGSIATLELAVSLMAKYQLGVGISKKDNALIVKFLQSLNGHLDEK